MCAVIQMMSLKSKKKNGDITEDDLRTQTNEVQKITDDSIKDIDKLLEEKELNDCIIKKLKSIRSNFKNDIPFRYVIF